ncbi:MAG: hypothetical protein ABIQ12_13575 [Opitutaceae bacterium]
MGFSGQPAGTAAEPPTLRLDLPWLAGSRTERIFPAATTAGSRDGVQLFHSGGLLLGHAREPFDTGDLATHAQALYRRILAASRGLHLCRIWNYVPRINAFTAGLENYRAFCLGRSLAFETEFGGAFIPLLPAASAVGSGGSQLEVIFAASKTAPRHFENPEQVPAYNYPLEHGPRPPSFARATVVRDGSRNWTFISGTAAIKGHQTAAPGSLGGQIDCTLDNLRLISHAAGLGADLGAGRLSQRHFKIYLRHPADLTAVQTRLDHDLLRAGDIVTYLQADICRAALAVEIEATLLAD